MKKFKLGIFFCILVILIVCSNKEEIASVVQDNTPQINELKEENQKLKDDLQNLKSDYSVYLQQLNVLALIFVNIPLAKG
ncbi:hypothetical protein [Ureibacillus sp. GCM10028918]|uniref:hypothetical protein n=1 Tax=Ureibacillus sp. GCM10028918 TaxID=3273429 RepID=UPI00360E7C1B